MCARFVKRLGHIAFIEHFEKFECNYVNNRRERYHAVYESSRNLEDLHMIESFGQNKRKQCTSLLSRCWTETPTRSTSLTDIKDVIVIACS